MNSSHPNAPLPAWIFIVTDLALIGAAAVIAVWSPHPLSASALLWIVACVGLGAIVLLVPLVARYVRRNFETLGERLSAGVALARCGVAAGELVSIAGGDPIFPELLESGLARDRIVDPLEVARRAPDLVLASWCGKKVDHASIRARVGWEAVPAIVHDRIVELRSSEVLQPGPAALTDGLDAIAAAIEGVANDLPVRSRLSGAKLAPRAC